MRWQLPLGGQTRQEFVIAVAICRRRGKAAL
jgi:hypothetical protein